MSEIPAFDALKRGHVVLAPDPFKADDDATRPWVVLNTEEHPFDGEEDVIKRASDGVLRSIPGDRPRGPREDLHVR